MFFKLPLTDQTLQQKWKLKGLNKPFTDRGAHNGQVLLIHEKYVSPMEEKHVAVTA